MGKQSRRRNRVLEISYEDWLRSELAGGRVPFFPPREVFWYERRRGRGQTLAELVVGEDVEIRLTVFRFGDLYHQLLCYVGRDGNLVSRSSYGRLADWGLVPFWEAVDEVMRNSDCCPSMSASVIASGVSSRAFLPSVN